MRIIHICFLLAGLTAMNCQTVLNDPCPNNPAVGSSGVESTSTSMSHNAGQTCLDCHDGVTSKAFDVAGTKTSGWFSTEVAAAGETVSSVGGKTLTVDQCGNFYDTTNNVTSSQPKTDNGSMLRPIPDGNCNNSGCHDGSSRSYIY